MARSRGETKPERIARAVAEAVHAGKEWQLPGDILMIEVSGTGRNTNKALENFRRQVAVPLLAAGAVPSPSSKTDLGSLCAR